MATPSRTSQRVRFGEFELDLSTRELWNNGTKQTLAPQPFQVLQLLIENRGQLVGHDVVVRHLWPSDTFVDYEQSLRKAVNRLREALKDSAEAPRFIETLPRQGYRFIGNLEFDTTSHDRHADHVVMMPKRVPDEPIPESEPHKPPWWKGKATIAVAVCVVVAAVMYPLVAPLIRRQIRIREFEQMTVVPLTTLPGHVWSPTFSPDGTQIAFVWSDETYAKGADLYAKVIGDEKPLNLTHWPEGTYTWWAAWSPDGKSIALCRKSGATAPEVVLISALGGTARRATSTSCRVYYHSALSWSPDGKKLAFLHHPADSPSDDETRLHVLSLDSMEDVPIKTDCKVVSVPVFSPRRDYLAYGCYEDLSAVSIYLHNLSNGRNTALLQGLDGVGGLAWSSDGRRIVFSTGIFGGELWEVSLDSPAHRVKLPFGHDVAALTVSYTGHRLAYRQTRTNTNIWRLDLAHPGDPAQKVVVSSREQHSPNYSPDGTQIAFESNRSGSQEVWISDADGSNATQLSSFGITFTGSPRWSPDGKLVAFDSRAGGESNIYIVDKRGGAPRKLNVDLHDNCEPTWSHERNWIYFLNGCVSGHPGIWKVPSTGGHASQLTKNESNWPVESPDGQYVYFSRDNWIWQVRTDGTQEQQVQGMPRMAYWAEFTPFGGGIYFLESVDGKYEIDYFDLNTKQVRPIHVMDKPPPNFMGPLSVSGDGRWLLFAQGDEFSSDLMMVENWR